MPADEFCTCGHHAFNHVGQSGRCRGADSYGLPCECPSLVHDPDDDEPPDDDWNENTAAGD